MLPAAFPLLPVAFQCETMRIYAPDPAGSGHAGAGPPLAMVTPAGRDLSETYAKPKRNLSET